MFQYIELLIGFLGTLFTAYEGYKRYLDEKQFNYYKETIKNLFSNDKEEEMSAIATLGVYANRGKYKKSTIDTLINMLYTELDYDISNAIIGVLIQAGKKDEIRYIASRIIEINRNFFIQSDPLKRREDDIRERVKELSGLKKEVEEKTEEAKEKESPVDIKSKDDQLTELEEVNKYRLTWHKLVTADVLSMILNKATKMGIDSGINLEFYQNDFNYSYLAGFSLDNFSIRHTAIGSGNIMDLKLVNLKKIYSSTFANSLIADCVFSGGEISGSSFCKCSFENVVFENVEFKDSFFFMARLRNCSFRNVKGLKPEQFYLAEIFPDTSFNGAISKEEISLLTPERVREYLSTSSIADYRYDEVIQYLPAT